MYTGTTCIHDYWQSNKFLCARFRIYLLVTRGGGKVLKQEEARWRAKSKTKEFRFSFTTFNKVHNVNEFASRLAPPRTRSTCRRKGSGRRKGEKLLIRGDMMYFWGFCVILDIFNLNIIEPLLPSLWGEAEERSRREYEIFLVV